MLVVQPKSYNMCQMEAVDVIQALGFPAQSFRTRAPCSLAEVLPTHPQQPTKQKQHRSYNVKPALSKFQYVPAL